jgi:S-adenosylmethionine:tRNA ribosyltransferase-isomerase
VKTELFDYELPEELIALHPPERRDGGRLLVLDPSAGVTRDAAIVDLPELLPAGSLLVANDTRVIPARLRGRRPTGGRVEVLLVRAIEPGAGSCRWTALARANRPLGPGDRIDLDGLGAEVVERGDRGAVVLSLDADVDAVRQHLEAAGEVPLPPYIKREPVEDDRRRYQTVYAEREGSVAAPTAGLHFTGQLVERIARAGHELAFVTLHVGPGTFRPITTEQLGDHAMDAEEYDIGAKTAAAIDRARARGRPVIAVGTTVVRCLEGCAEHRGQVTAGSGSTELFISPGFEFRIVDGLLTNFHLPRSTLLCLVSALAGRERVLQAYTIAVERRYRFYSYGDAMLILPEKR